MRKTPTKAYRWHISAPAAVTLGAALLSALLAGCESPSALAPQSALSPQKIGDVCEETMSLDVSGAYFPKCVDYLRSHATTQRVVVNMTEPAEHRACQEIGLANGSPDYQSCVQEMVQLDLGAAHL
jgi:hypothetical protein